MDLKWAQHWEIHHIPGVVISRADCSHYEKCSFAVQQNLPRGNLYPLPLVFSLWKVISFFVVPNDTPTNILLSRLNKPGPCLPALVPAVASRGCFNSLQMLLHFPWPPACPTLLGEHCAKYCEGFPLPPVSAKANLWKNNSFSFSVGCQFVVYLFVLSCYC